MWLRELGSSALSRRCLRAPEVRVETGCLLPNPSPHNPLQSNLSQSNPLPRYFLRLRVPSVDKRRDESVPVADRSRVFQDASRQRRGDASASESMTEDGCFDTSSGTVVKHHPRTTRQASLPQQHHGRLECTVHDNPPRPVAAPPRPFFTLTPPPTWTRKASPGSASP